jgi:thiol:disulfide interchange protein DsbC
MHFTLRISLVAAALLASSTLWAQEAAIRKTLAERLPQLKIDEVARTPIAGLYEVRVGSDIFYSDDKGEYIFVRGAMIETRTRTDLTEARVEKLLAIDFDKLPLKDAIAIRQGSGARRMAVFVDPNCGYCKRFERDLVTIKDVTIYAFLLPILGPDSTVKAGDVWCAKEPAKVWRAWMLDGVTPPKVSPRCDTAALDRNREFANKQRINGTPAVFFADGVRKAGAIPVDQVEKLLASAAAKK